MAQGGDIPAWIAFFIGLYALAAGVGEIRSPGGWGVMLKEFERGLALRYLTGLITLALGATIYLVNPWVPEDWLAIVVSVMAGSACASKGFVRTQVGDVNTKVNTLGTSLEATQERTRQNEARIGEVDTKADAGNCGTCGKACPAIEGGTVKLAIAGSGDLMAAGKADKVDISIAGSGDIDAKGLVSRTADVSIAGSGGVAAHATETADVSIMGSGDVELVGGAKCSVSKMGSGNVHCS